MARSHEFSTTARVTGGSVRLEIAPRLLTRYHQKLGDWAGIIRLASPPNTVPRAKRPDAGTHSAF